MLAFGSTTFRRKRKNVGLEPDECYYLKNAAAARSMNPAVDPPPDLAVEVDISSRSIPREPIYARLGVPELWRFNGRRVQVLCSGSVEGTESRGAAPSFHSFPWRDSPNL